MPMLLEDLAKETSASNRRVFDRLHAEARDLHKLEREAVELQQKVIDSAALRALEELHQQVVDSAQQATEYALSRIPQAEGVWRSALALLRKKPSEDEAKRLLQNLLNVFESDLGIVEACRTLWAITEQLKIAPERLDELDRAEGRFQELAAQAKLALEHRIHGWQPADPDRLALGLQRAREGKTVKADEARAWFRKTPG